MIKIIKVNETYFNLNCAKFFTLHGDYTCFSFKVHYGDEFYKSEKIYNKSADNDDSGNVIEIEKLLYDFMANENQSFLDLNDYILKNQ